MCICWDKRHIFNGLLLCKQSDPWIRCWKERVIPRKVSYSTNTTAARTPATSWRVKCGALATPMEIALKDLFAVYFMGRDDIS